MLKSYGWVVLSGLQDFSVSPGSGSLSLSQSKSLSEPVRACVGLCEPVRA